jgi:hypothetical protein
MTMAALRPFLVVVAAALMCVVGQSGVAHAYTDRDYFVVNGTPHAIVLARYKTGNPYPEYVDPPNRIEPGQKFKIGLRQDRSTTLVQIDFDTFNDAGAQIPAGMVELRLVYKRDPTTYAVSVACWPGVDRSCSPRGWGDLDTVVFTG